MLAWLLCVCLCDVTVVANDGKTGTGNSLNQAIENTGVPAGQILSLAITQASGLTKTDINEMFQTLQVLQSITFGRVCAFADGVFSESVLPDSLEHVVIEAPLEQIAERAFSGCKLHTFSAPSVASVG